MASDLVSLADASALLGVSVERVRQLVVAGDLPGVKIGNAWAVPRASIAARRDVSNRQGRPLSARRAWLSIIAGDVDLSNLSRFRNRGEPCRYEMSRSDVLSLSNNEAVVVSGVAAAVERGQLLSPEIDKVDLYIVQSVHTRLIGALAAIADPLGVVVVRVVSDDVWPLVDESAIPANDRDWRLAPDAAVALDLRDSGDPRHWVAAERLVASHG